MLVLQAGDLFNQDMLVQRVLCSIRMTFVFVGGVGGWVEWRVVVFCLKVRNGVMAGLCNFAPKQRPLGSPETVGKTGSSMMG